MVLKTSCVEQNLWELTTAAATKGPGLSQLVVWGDTIYDGSRGWGRVWKWLTSFLLALWGEHPDFQKVQQAMIHTQQAFFENVALVKQHFVRYQQYLEGLRRGEEQDERRMADSRRIITEWNSMFRSLKDPRFQECVGKVQEVYRLLFNTELEKDFGIGKVVKDASLHQIVRYQKILDLEARLNMPLSMACLEVLSRGEGLSREQAHLLAKWIAKVNSSHLSVRKFHHALAMVVAHLYPNQQGIHFQLLARLEWELVKRGCLIFGKRDEKHLKSIEEAEKNKTVLCCGKEYRFGDFLGQRKEKGDRHFVYTLANDPHKVVAFGVNEAILGIEQMRVADEGWGIPMVQCYAVDSQRGCALFERLHHPLHGLQWESLPEIEGENDPLTEADGKKVSALAAMVHWMLKQKQTPESFSPQYLMFDQKGVLKTVKVATKAPFFDFNALVQFAMSCSGANWRVFRKLSRASGLAIHAYSKLYFAVIQGALGGDAKEVKTEAALANITDPKIVDRAETLQKEVLAMRDKCCQKIKENYGVSMSDQDLANIVTKEILFSYEGLGCAGYFLKDFKKHIIANIVQRYSLKARSF